ncbi:hypothetical protein IFM89_010713 [Coptis chinensis]|uniref:Uncharacterized protein n=1 Tax=Coptis chinensis TaxID=261450 RepID=A0A835M568_9MAGN|nr:hypothetical protein IFM89_010713 [Coptis chinensis]
MESQTSRNEAAAEKLRSDFLHALRSRRSDQVSVEYGKPAMESCPRENIENLKDQLKEENLYITTEASEQGHLPVLILSMKESKQQKRPSIVFLHSTHKCKEWLRPLLEAYASRGYIAIAIDSRYHGERDAHITTYRDVCISFHFPCKGFIQSWKIGDTMPFIFDTHKISKLRSRLGRTTWIKKWWKSFVIFHHVTVMKMTCPTFEQVWDRIAPGLASKFDSPDTIPAIAPRPLLILNGAEDPRCPLEGLNTPISKARGALRATNCSENFELIAQPGIGHQMTPLMVK